MGAFLILIIPFFSNADFSSDYQVGCTRAVTKYQTCKGNSICHDHLNTYIQEGMDACNHPSTNSNYLYFQSEKTARESSDEVRAASIIPEEKIEGKTKEEIKEILPEEKEVTEKAETEPAADSDDEYAATADDPPADDSSTDDYGYYNDDPIEGVDDSVSGSSYGNYGSLGGESVSAGRFGNSGGLSTSVGLGNESDLNVRVQGVSGEVTHSDGKPVVSALPYPDLNRKELAVASRDANRGGVAGGGQPPAAGSGGQPNTGALDNNLMQGKGGGRRGGGGYRSAFADEVSKRRNQGYMEGASPNAVNPAVNLAAGKRAPKLSPPKYRAKTDHALSLLARHRKYQEKNYYNQFGGSGSRISEYDGKSCLDMVFCNMEAFFTNKVERLPTSEINPDSLK